MLIFLVHLTTPMYFRCYIEEKYRTAWRMLCLSVAWKQEDPVTLKNCGVQLS
jgi:hypothetical protein